MLDWDSVLITRTLCLFLQVIQGMLQAHDSVIIGKEHCVQLFAHETTRVFHDRLTCSTDRITFFQILADNLHAYFKVRTEIS